MIRFSNKRPKAGEWTVTLAVGKPYEFGSSAIGWRWARFGIFKLRSELPEGVVISDHDYIGFLWQWYYWLPFGRR